jgi:hypothetical protein
VIAFLPFLFLLLLLLLLLRLLLVLVLLLLFLHHCLLILLLLLLLLYFDRLYSPSPVDDSSFSLRPTSRTPMQHFLSPQHVIKWIRNTRRVSRSPLPADSAIMAATVAIRNFRGTTKFHLDFSSFTHSKYIVG